MSRKSKIVEPKSKRIVVMSDLHCGHHAGLTPPSYHHRMPEGAPRAMKKRFAWQVGSWDWFSTNVRKVRPIDVLIVNADCIEGKGERSGGTELLTADRKEQSNMAASIIKFVGAEKIYMTYGTASHVGREEDWEDWIAEEVEAEKIEAEGHYEVNGLQIAVKHKIGNSTSPISSKTAMSSAQIRQLLWSARGQQPQANLIIRSHIHRCYFIGEPALNFQGWVTPGLQGLGSKFGTREVDGLPIDFGFLVIDVVDKNTWGVTAYLASASMQKCEVISL